MKNKNVEEIDTSGWKGLYFGKEKENRELRERNDYLEDKNRKQEIDLKKAKEQLRIKMAVSELQHEKEINHLNEIIGNQAEMYQKIIAEKESSIEQLYSSLTTLLRVQIEKANVERGLPKKGHDGYIILCGKSAVNNEGDILYPYRIQTPYRVTLSINTIQNQVMHDLKYGKFLKDIGCEGFYSEELGRVCGCLFKSMELTPNGVSGFYEVTIFFTELLDNIPEERFLATFKK